MESTNYKITFIRTDNSELVLISNYVFILGFWLP